MKETFTAKDCKNAKTIRLNYILKKKKRKCVSEAFLTRTCITPRRRDDSKESRKNVDNRYAVVDPAICVTSFHQKKFVQ